MGQAKKQNKSGSKMSKQLGLWCAEPRGSFACGVVNIL